MAKQSKKERHRVKRKEKQRRIRLHGRDSRSKLEIIPRKLVDDVVEKSLELISDVIQEGDQLNLKLREEIAALGQESGLPVFKLTNDIDSFFNYSSEWSWTASKFAPLKTEFEARGRDDITAIISTLCLAAEEQAFADDLSAKGKRSSRWPFVAKEPSFLEKGQHAAVLDFRHRLPFMLYYFYFLYAEPVGRQRTALVKIVCNALAETNYLLLDSPCALELIEIIGDLLNSDPAKLRPGVVLFRQLDVFFQRHHYCFAHGRGLYRGMLFFIRAYLLKSMGESFCSAEHWVDYPAIMEHLFGWDPFGVSAQVLTAKLSCVDTQKDKIDWASFLSQRLELNKLNFEESLIVKLTQLRLAKEAKHQDEGSEAEYANTVASVMKWLSHGVPKGHQELVQRILPHLIDYYLDDLSLKEEIKIHWPTLKPLSLADPLDYRLAIIRFCLDRSARSILSKQNSNSQACYRKVSPGLLVEALTYLRKSEEKAELFQLFYLPLSREQRKDCLLQLFYVICKSDKASQEEKRDLWETVRLHCMRNEKVVFPGGTLRGVYEPELMLLYLANIAQDAENDYQTRIIQAITELDWSELDKLIRWLRGNTLKTGVLRSAIERILESILLHSLNSEPFSQGNLIRPLGLLRILSSPRMFNLSGKFLAETADRKDLSDAQRKQLAALCVLIKKDKSLKPLHLWLQKAPALKKLLRSYSSNDLKAELCQFDAFSGQQLSSVVNL